MIALRTLKAIASFQSKLPKEQEASAMAANARKEIEIPNQNVCFISLWAWFMWIVRCLCVVTFAFSALLKSNVRRMKYQKKRATKSSFSTENVCFFFITLLCLTSHSKIDSPFRTMVPLLFAWVLFFSSSNRNVFVRIRCGYFCVWIMNEKCKVKLNIV